MIESIESIESIEFCKTRILDIESSLTPAEKLSGKTIYRPLYLLSSSKPFSRLDCCCLFLRLYQVVPAMKSTETTETTASVAGAIPGGPSKSLVTDAEAVASSVTFWDMGPGRTLRLVVAVSVVVPDAPDAPDL